MKSSRAFGIGAILALGLAAASCGSDDEPPSGGSGRGGRAGSSGRGGTAGSSGAAGTAGRGGASGTAGRGGASGTGATGGAAGTGATGGSAGTAGMVGTGGRGGTAGMDAGDAAGGTAGMDAGDAAGGTAGADASDAAGGTSGNDASADTGADVAVDTGVDVAVDTGTDAVVDSGDAAVANVVINEIQPNNPDHVELYNRGSATVTLTGWTILDAQDSGGGRPYNFPAGTTIAAGAYLTITTTLGFGLGDPDQLRLFNANGDVVDSYSWTDLPTPTSESFSRCPNGTGNFVERPETENAANDCPP